MSVFIYQQDALDLMASVEGERWKQQQLDPKKQDQWAFFTCLRAWQRLDPTITQQQRESRNFLRFSLIDETTQGVIYGNEGWTRYTVRNSGEIWFIELQSPSKEVTELARKAGFGSMGEQS